MTTRHRHILATGRKPLPTEILTHETVINDADGLMWYKNAAGVVVPCGVAASAATTIDNLVTADGQNVKVTGDQDIAGIKRMTSTDYMKLPSGTTAQASAAELGGVRFDEDEDELMVRKAAGWAAVGGGVGGAAGAYYMPKGVSSSQYTYFKYGVNSGLTAGRDLSDDILPNISGNGFTRSGQIGYPIIVARAYNTQTGTYHNLIDLSNTSGGVLTHVILPASGTTATNNGLVRITVDGVEHTTSFYTAYNRHRPWLGGIEPIFGSGGNEGSSSSNAAEPNDNNWIYTLASSESNPSSNFQGTVMSPHAALQRGIGIPFKSSLKVEYYMSNTISTTGNERQAYAVVVNSMVI